MQGERLLDRLVENDVIDDSGEAPALSESFRESVETYESELALCEEDELTEHVRSETSGLQVPNRGSTLDADDLPYLAELLALSDRLADPETALQVLPTLDLFGENSPPVDGTPEFFVQVTPPRLRTLVKLYERTIVYAWGHECPPCDIVRGDFDELLEEPIEGIPLLAVCGEGYHELLYDEFRLRGAPTVLFMIDGQSDLRLEGAHHQEVLENELDKFPTVSSPVTLSDPEEENDVPENSPDTADRET